MGNNNISIELNYFDKSIIDLFEQQVEKTPDAAALIFEDHTLSYTELNQQANQLAHRLINEGVQPGMLIGICLTRSVDFVVALLSVFKSHAAAMPLDTNYPSERLRFMLDEAETSFVISLSTCKHLIGSKDANIICLDIETNAIGKQSSTSLVNNLDPDQLAYVIFTSGSAGLPKGVEVSHRQILNRLQWMWQTYPFTIDEVCVQKTSFNFIDAIWEIFGPLLKGVPTVICSDRIAVDSRLLLNTLAKHQVSRLLSVPTLFTSIIKTETHLSTVLPQLKLWVFSGESLSFALFQRFQEALPNTTLCNIYGASEAWDATWFDPQKEKQARLNNNIPIGRPITNIQVYILDASMQMMPVGIPGELHIGGAGLARGYLNRPELTAEKFIPNPFGEGRIYKTGDRARYLDDGNIEYLGRLDHQVKLRGFRIELGEIETTIISLPEIQQSVVQLREDLPGDPRLVAYLVPDTSIHLDKASNKQALLWEDTWDATYTDSDVFDTKILNLHNFSGWVSSYTGQPFPNIEMQEWLANTVSRIQSLHPTRILEIGCGTGLILFQLAQQSEEYWGIDVSSQALAYIEHQQTLLKEDYLSNVRLFKRQATDLEGVPQNTFDTVIINSVAQYFPSAQYLIDVIAKIISIIQKNGKIFIGDIRNASLLNALHTSVKLSISSSNQSTKQLKKQIEKAVYAENELCIAPEFFIALQHILPAISDVEILLKEGTNQNELNKFRYDVILYIGENSSPTTDSEMLHWEKDELSLASIQEFLSRETPQSLVIKSIPNASIADDVCAYKAITNETVPNNIEDLLNSLSCNPDQNGLLPIELMHLCEEFDYSAKLTWDIETKCVHYHAVIIHKDNLLRSESICTGSLYSLASDIPANLEAYTTHPTRRRHAHQLITKAKQTIKNKLPDYMFPSKFVCLEELPLTPNGKIDRKALPTPDTNRPELSMEYVAPRNALETQLVELWQEILQVDQIGIYDNFFSLGGHSLLATQLALRIREVLEVEIPLSNLFETEHIAALKNQIEQVQSSEGKAIKIPSLIPEPDHVNEPFPLTDVQQAYWIGRTSSYALGNIATHNYSEYRISDLDFSRYERALRNIITRHDMLRAIFLDNGTQKILLEVPDYHLKIDDLRTNSQEEIDAHLKKIRERMSHQVFDVSQWPLFEFRVSQINDTHIYLHISLDLLIVDDWSIELLFSEITQYYQDPTLVLPKPALSFRDYVLAEQNFQNSKLYERAFKYWQARLADFAPAPELPLAISPSSIEKPTFIRQTNFLDASKWSRLKEHAKQAEITPSGVLLAAYAEVLARWSKNSKFTINLTLYNRLPFHPEVNDIIGDFTSLILLEIDCSENISFKQRARAIQKQLWNDIDHAYVSGVRVLREITKLHGNPLIIPVVFTSTLGNTTNEEINKSVKNKPSHELVYSISQTPQVWLDNIIYEVNGELFFNWDAVEALFPDDMLQDMFTAYSNLLQHLIDDADAWNQPIQELLLPQRHLEIQQATNATKGPTQAVLLHDLFNNQVKQCPKQQAVVTSDKTLSYKELYQRSQHLACKLLSLGAKSNMLVAIVMHKGWEQIVATLGILQAGAAYLPIDPELPQERLEYLLTHSDISIVLTQSEVNASISLPENITLICVDEQTVSLSIPHITSVQSPKDLAYVIFTSGSTGLPKGVMIDHQGAVNTVLDINQRFAVTANDRVLALSALNFDLSVYDLFGTLATGGTIVIPDEQGTKDPAHWFDCIEQQQVTVWNSVPALLSLLVEYVQKHNKTLPDCLRLALLSGDWIPLQLPVQVESLATNLEIVSLGGATEASIWSILYPIKKVSPDWSSIPYGKPMLNQQIYVLNDQLEHCPLWVPGQLYIGGIGLAKGYWKDEEKSNASFIRHPITKARLYKTGDLGRWLPNGNIEFLGREDFQVKIQGHRIELGEIETTLETHTDINTAIVLALGDLNNKRLIAYVTTNKTKEINTETLREYLTTKLSPYMVPSMFVCLKDLPLTPNGKVDRTALNQIKPDVLDVVESDTKTTEATTDTEKLLVDIIQNDLEVESINVNQNFFELSLTSIQLIRLHIKLEEIFPCSIKVTDLFDHPTISDLASKINTIENNKRNNNILVNLHEHKNNKSTHYKEENAPIKIIRDPDERKAFKNNQLNIRNIGDDETYIYLNSDN